MTGPGSAQGPRVLVLAEQANPEWTSVPLVGWSHARALTKIARVHVVTQVRNAPAFRKAGLTDDDFTPIDSEKLARPMWSIARVLRGGAGKGWTTATAIGALAYPYFERLVWAKFGDRIRAREFDIVHRITPLTPTAPSPIARRCSAAGVPFVLGPLNGGVPWPRGFDAARRREREWLSYVRGAYRWLPGYRATRRHAAAIIVGSRDTLAQVPPWAQSKCVYIPENGIEPERFSDPPSRGPPTPLGVLFLGRLVPYKGCDMLLDAAAELLRAGRITLDIVGDGPEAAALKGQASRLGIDRGLIFHGWVEHSRVQERLARAHVLGFPSIREFGGGVVLEAMAMGVVPVVVDYGGPAELVTPATGAAVPMGPRADIVNRFRAALTDLCDHPEDVLRMSRAAHERARRSFTWEAKAAQTMEVYRWVLGGRLDKPDFGCPIT